MALTMRGLLKDEQEGLYSGQHAFAAMPIGQDGSRGCSQLVTTTFFFISHFSCPLCPHDSYSALECWGDSNCFGERSKLQYWYISFDQVTF